MSRLSGVLKRFMNRIFKPNRADVLVARRNFSLLVIFVLFAALISACNVDIQNPPRQATATARAATTPATPAPPLVLPVPSATNGSDDGVSGIIAPTETEISPALGEAGQGLTVWIDETSPAHKLVMDELAADFADQFGVNVAVQLVSPALLPELVSTGVLSGTLPDLILHPIEYTAGWVEDGILDPIPANEVIDRLGRETFDASALELLTTDGLVAAIPSDGYHQLLLYRADWFEDLGLSAPETFTAMATAAERIFNPEAIISGLVIPTESNLVTTHQAFEQIALANRCRLIDEAGEVVILDAECSAAIEHYYTTINRFSPSGVQTDTSAAIAFLTGRTGMIVTSPAILPDLAGFDPEAMPECLECDTVDGVNYLARNTGILTEIRGPSGAPTGFGNIRSLGITTAADREVAQVFAEFWFEEGYERWLAVDSERKVPMRLGNQSEARRYIEAWGDTPVGDSDLTLKDIYGEEVILRLRDGISSAPRWGIREGFGDLMTRLYEDNVISIVLQEMLSGYFNTSTTLRETYRRTVEFIPNYSFPDRLTEEETVP